MSFDSTCRYLCPLRVLNLSDANSSAYLFRQIASNIGWFVTQVCSLPARTKASTQFAISVQQRVSFASTNFSVLHEPHLHLKKSLFTFICIVLS